MVNPASGFIQSFWFRHPVVFQGGVQRTAFGVTRAENKTVKASVNATERTVLNRDGEEVTGLVTIHYPPCDYVPKPGDVFSVPDGFGLGHKLTVVTARMVDSGTGVTPVFVEVVGR